MGYHLVTEKKTTIGSLTLKQHTNFQGNESIGSGEEVFFFK